MFFLDVFINVLFGHCFKFCTHKPKRKIRRYLFMGNILKKKKVKFNPGIPLFSYLCVSSIFLSPKRLRYALQYHWTCFSPHTFFFSLFLSSLLCTPSAEMTLSYFETSLSWLAMLCFPLSLCFSFVKDHTEGWHVGGTSWLGGPAAGKMWVTGSAFNRLWE